MKRCKRRLVIAIAIGIVAMTLIVIFFREIALGIFIAFCGFLVMLESLFYNVPVGPMKMVRIDEDIAISYKVVRFRDNKNALRKILSEPYPTGFQSVTIFKNGTLYSDDGIITSDAYMLGLEVDYTAYHAETADGGHSGWFAAFETFSDKKLYKYHQYFRTDSTKWSLRDGDTIYSKVRENLVWTFSPSFPESCGYKFTINNAPPEATVTLDYWIFDTDVLQEFLNVVFYYHQQTEYTDTKRFVLSSGDCEVEYDGDFFQIEIK